jgi:hypothetical protein
MVPWSSRQRSTSRCASGAHGELDESAIHPERLVLEVDLVECFRRTAQQQGAAW